ncbi:MAG: Crp/Fnr family transcriptional regulator [Aphanocapsa lilacina HA4352-LM1]|jgi:CRP-like cAMP-binding protein|uniref:Crp/Fnr family transcriptional regulator n=1 Tax=Gloeobacter morelensis MG652769 TaxID=2781736 RepID=A0ABY3PNV0_9CYAN|nr:Crp/Fnr family transcriptional regulator [Gloeobacter morelensis]MBW4700263.1 Crp/Fnr family transcriptional regulator [Aphanocapsa lilacina HA4352-LM1]UFP95290.1 Crp/Fnr family transcriptional regulator [Gloeobacter morelensis MG652769]
MSNRDAQQDFRLLLEELYRERTLRFFKAGQSIPLRNQEIWIVYRGLVQLATLQPSGDEALLGLAGPLMPLGRSLTLLEPYHAVALTNVDLLRLTTEEIHSSPRLARELTEQMARRLRQAEALLALAGKRLVIDRLQGFLYLLAHEFGHPTGEGIRIDVRLTHQQFANALGTTRVTVTRFLGELKYRGLIEIGSDRRIYLKEPQRLAAASCF